MGDNPVVVEIRSSGSHGKTWNRTEQTTAERLLAELLERAGFEGPFQAVLGKAIRGCDSDQRVQVKHPETYGVRVAIQPESKDSRREVLVTAPHGMTGDDFFTRLKAALVVEECGCRGRSDADEDPLPPSPEPPPAAAPPATTRPVVESEEQRLEREFFEFDAAMDRAQMGVEDAARRLPGSERELRSIEEHKLPELARELQEIEARAAAIRREQAELNPRRTTLASANAEFRRIIDEGEHEVVRLRGERDLRSARLEELKQERKLNAASALLATMREQMKGLGLSDAEIDEVLKRGSSAAPPNK